MLYYLVITCVAVVSLFKNISSLLIHSSSIPIPAQQSIPQVLEPLSPLDQRVVILKTSEETGLLKVEHRVT